MKKFLSLFALAILSSCASAPSQLGHSLVSDTREALLISSNTGTTKTGISCGKNILGFYATGDISIEAAMKNGHITKVVSVDKTIENNVFTSKVCVIVKGN